jgi:hypothetical protein
MNQTFFDFTQCSPSINSVRPCLLRGINGKAKFLGLLLPVCLEMAMGKNPLGITCPNPYPRRKNTPAKKPIPMTGIKFYPNPYPCGFRVPNRFPIPTNINTKKFIM